MRKTFGIGALLALLTPRPSHSPESRVHHVLLIIAKLYAVECTDSLDSVFHRGFLLPLTLSLISLPTRLRATIR